EQRAGVSHDAIKQVHAEREVGAVDHRAPPARLLDGTAYLGFPVLPAGRPLHERHAGPRAGRSVAEHGVAAGEVDRRVVAAQPGGERGGIQPGVPGRHHRADLEAVRARPRAARSTIFRTGSTGPTSRIWTSACAASGMTLGRVPPAITPTLHVVSPNSGSVGQRAARSSASTASRSSMADWPSSGYAEWALFPSATSRSRSEPFVPVASLFSVGSPLMSQRQSRARGCRFAARAPLP